VIQITPQMRILVAIEAVDGRKGIDSLAQLCQEKLQADPFLCLFVFRSRRGKGPSETERPRIRIDSRTHFADDELTAPLRIAPASNEMAVYCFTLDDLEELMGCVAAEANHAKDQKLQKELDRLFERIEEVLNSYTDEDDGPAD
jgi:hypothetical protein